MANIKSSEKRAEIDLRNRERNRARISKMKSAIKSALQALQSGDDKKAEALHRAVKVIDSVEQKGTIHKNKAARLKSRLTQKFVKAS